MIYNPLNLLIDKLREYNVEKYHFLSVSSILLNNNGNRQKRTHYEGS